MMDKIKKLADALPDLDILVDEHDVVRFNAGVRGETGKAMAVLRPCTSQQLCHAVSYLTDNAIAFMPQGGNTGLVGASIPDESGEQVVISLERLKETFILDIDNRSLQVSAGYRLSEVNEKLADHGLFLPIDLGADPQIGGMIATNTGGGRFLRYGDMRKQVLGLSIVTPSRQAKPVMLGSAVRKSNLGTDWKQLAIGSGSHYGIITEAIVNVEAIPRQQAAALVIPSDSEAVFHLLQKLERMAGPLLSAFEFMSQEAMKAAFAHSPSLRNPFSNNQVPNMALLVELTKPSDQASWESPIDEILQQMLMSIWDSGSASFDDALFGSVEDMWALRHALSEGVRTAGHLYAFDLGFRRQDVLTFHSFMKEELPATFPDIRICDFGHVGDGGLHFNLVAPRDKHSPAFERALRDWVVKQAVERFDASFSAEHGIGPKNIRYFALYGPKNPFEF